MLTEKEKALALKKYMNMRLIDSALMNIAFKDNLAAVEYVIQTILNRKDLKVESSTLQDYQALPNNQKSVVLDILAKDTEGNYYNVEMQNQPSLASAKRARFHCSMLDSTILQKGQDYEEISEVYVIFIVDGPFLGVRNVPIEFYERIGINTGRKLGDKQTIVYVNAKCREGNTELAKLMRDLTARKTEEIDSIVLKNAVDYAKEGDGRNMYIEGLNYNQDEIWEKATKVATLATTINNIRSFHNNGVSVELISKSTNFSVEEIENILNTDSTK